MSTTAAIDIDQFAINTAKGLIMDTVRNADSGHTGGPFSSLDHDGFVDENKLNPERGAYLHPGWYQDVRRFRIGISLSF